MDGIWAQPVASQTFQVVLCHLCKSSPIQTPNTQSKQNQFCTLVLQILRQFQEFRHRIQVQPLGVIIAYCNPPFQCLCSCCPCFSRCFHRPCFHVSLCDLLGKRLAGSVTQNLSGKSPVIINMHSLRQTRQSIRKIPTE